VGRRLQQAENGWAIAPQWPTIRCRLSRPITRKAPNCWDIIERQVIPLYYQRNGHGIPKAGWRMSKASIKSILPQFNSQRMVMDYIRDFYSAANKQCKKLAADQYGAPRRTRGMEGPGAAYLAARCHCICRQAARGRSLLGALCRSPSPCSLYELTGRRCVVWNACRHGRCATAEFVAQTHFDFAPAGSNGNGETLFRLDLIPPLAGLQHYKLRMYPPSKLLSAPVRGSAACCGCKLRTLGARTRRAQRSLVASSQAAVSD